MPKTLSIDQEVCIGCGHCHEVCPLVFELDDDNKSSIVGPGKCGTCNCQEAIDTCPVQAIRWEW